MDLNNRNGILNAMRDVLISIENKILRYLDKKKMEDYLRGMD
ncbi:hypothetical protein SBF1_1560010 [Candidatus Desulfosporosinus infrequens]|uniref:Uncharacterized protein n=1 Tax=Candidatus Desulfosporosinus infrequens TaxID=2043169 RepID=A0A2U3K7W8_9FIRM|nr:hypothetical protein SBF1_1560010 [Candidatus Desulfosporosinus infrequens]